MSATPLHETPGYDERPCKGTDPNLYYPERGDMETLRAARSICAQCPVSVRWACLDYALTHNEDEGVWGGLSGAERRRLVSSRTRGNGVKMRTLTCGECGEEFRASSSNYSRCGLCAGRRSA